MLPQSEAQSKTAARVALLTIRCVSSPGALFPCLQGDSDSRERRRHRKATALLNGPSQRVRAACSVC